MNQPFTHLHLHTEFSMLDGSSKISELVRRTKELGMDSVAITDHGVMYGVIDFYKQAKKAGIKPIIGVEAYIVQDRKIKKKGEKRKHLVLLAKNKLKNILLLNLFNEDNSIKYFGKILFLNLKKLALVEKNELVVYHLILKYFASNNAVTPKTMNLFFEDLKQGEKKLYDILIKNLRDALETQKFVSDSPISVFIQNINKEPNSSKPIKLDTVIDFEILEYYIEFGSFRFKDRHISLSDLHRILQKALKQDPIRIKKKLHLWSKSFYNIKNILKLFSVSKTLPVLNIIHPELNEKFQTLDKIFTRVYDKNLFLLLGYGSIPSLINEILFFWSKNALIVELEKKKNVDIQAVTDEAILKAAEKKKTDDGKYVLSNKFKKLVHKPYFG